MARIKPKPARTPAAEVNGSAGEVMTLSEAASYLRLPESEVSRLAFEQGLPGRHTGTEWRFFKAAIQQWLSQPLPKPSKEAQMAVAGSLRDDPNLEAIVEEIYRQRGRPITEDGSYKLFHGLSRESEKK